MRSDEEHVKYYQRSEGDLGDFGETTPTNSFSGGETDHLFINHHGEQFYDLDVLAGLGHPGDGRTICQMDYDRDGWIDFVVSAANKPTIQLQRNRMGERLFGKPTGASMIALRFQGGNRTAKANPDWSPRDGYGAVFSVDLGGEHKPLLREYRCGDGRAAQNSDTMIVGIGDSPAARSIVVTFSSGKKAEARDVPVGKLVTFYENPADAPNGQSSFVEDYILDVLEGSQLSAKNGVRLPIAIPDGEPGPRYRLVTAMKIECPACKKQMPQVAELQKSFSTEELGIYGVSTLVADKAGDDEDTPAELEAYVTEHGPAYRVLTQAKPEERRLVRQFVRDAFKDDLTPVCILTDAGGRVLETFSGVPSISDVRKSMQKAEGK